MIWLLLALAAAQEAPPSEEADESTVSAPEPSDDTASEDVVDEPSSQDLALPSALDEFEQTARENLADPDAGQLADLLPMSEMWRSNRSIWGGGWYFRPRIAWVHHQAADIDYDPMWLGLRVGRRGFQLERDVAMSWDASFTAEFPSGQRTQGRDLSTAIMFGLNASNVGLRLGPGWVHNQILFRGTPGPLESAQGFTARADLIGNLGKLGVFVGAEPVWWLTEGRTDVPNFGLGDEVIWHGGLAFKALSVDLSHRLTADGSIQRIGLGLRILGG